jgi:hypothetical protein
MAKSPDSAEHRFKVGGKPRKGHSTGCPGGAEPRQGHSTLCAGGNTPPTYDPPEHDGAMDIDQAPMDTFITDLEADDAPRHVPNQGHGLLVKKLMFSSQEMPEEQAAAFTAPPQSMISPKTLFVLTKEEMQQKGTPICNKKKERKWKKKMKQPLPLCAQRLRFLTGC